MSNSRALRRFFIFSMMIFYILTRIFHHEAAVWSGSWIFFYFLFLKSFRNAVSPIKYKISQRVHHISIFWKQTNNLEDTYVIKSWNCDDNDLNAPLIAISCTQNHTNVSPPTQQTINTSSTWKVSVSKTMRRRWGLVRSGFSLPPSSTTPWLTGQESHTPMSKCNLCKLVYPHWPSLPWTLVSCSPTPVDPSSLGS